jgi:hypothetical protein
MDEKIKVFVRVRPCTRLEIGKEVIVFTDKKKKLIKVSDISTRVTMESVYNQVFDERST